MAKITIDEDRCKGCMLCIAFCPKGLISQDKNLNRRGVKPVRFSRRADLNNGGIPPITPTADSAKGKKAGNAKPECLGCVMCAIICPDCCIEVYK